MGSLLWLLVLSVSMLTGSFMAGNLPLAISLSAERLRLVSTFGSGLLVGTALVVIIPEGVDTLYSANAALSAAPGSALAPGDQHAAPASTARATPGAFVGLAASSGLADAMAPVLVREGGHDHDHDHGPGEAIEPHKLIGPALIFGFMFMFFIDQISAHSHPHGSSRIAVSDLRDQALFTKKKVSATIGLVVHAAADGIALGAASSSNTESLELIVFLAIMLHKAPSAFGLCTFLMQEGYSRREIRSHLLVFSAAAPLAAIVTFLAVTQADIASPARTQLWTGVLLLFSAGTFLYVATVHILPEIYQPPAGSHDHTHNHSEKSLSRGQIACLVAGFVTPMILAIERTALALNLVFEIANMFSRALTVLPGAWAVRAPHAVAPALAASALARCPAGAASAALGAAAVQLSQVRWATKKSGGSTTNTRTSLPKFLGFKRLHGTKVEPGNIILRQRGTQWHPGTGVGIGRDHTIYALAKGVVVLHYDLATQRRFVSINDGTLEYFPTKNEMKRRLVDSLDSEHYIGLSSKGRYDYVMEKIKELTDADEQQRKMAAESRLASRGRRRFDLVDLTLL
ncbi:hypothetical protein HK105_204516 [Polyrhizophydium stewartii]|uniref:Uncharacterized protein n=1 Tax=Polyrhizophydium stewartii TaxID=2732419 RepID=A0ABR4N8I1_9FUNG